MPRTKKIVQDNQPVFVMLKTNDKGNSVVMFDTKQFKGLVQSDFIETSEFNVTFYVGSNSFYCEFNTADNRQSCINDVLQAVGLSLNQPQVQDDAPQV